MGHRTRVQVEATHQPVRRYRRQHPAECFGCSVSSSIAIATRLGYRASVHLPNTAGTRQVRCRDGRQAGSAKGQGEGIIGQGRGDSSGGRQCAGRKEGGSVGTLHVADSAGIGRLRLDLQSKSKRTGRTNKYRSSSSFPARPRTFLLSCLPRLSRDTRPLDSRRAKTSLFTCT
jgi:hypothetical protein